MLTPSHSPQKSIINASPMMPWGSTQVQKTTEFRTIRVCVCVTREENKRRAVKFQTTGTQPKNQGKDKSKRRTKPQAYLYPYPSHPYMSLIIPLLIQLINQPVLRVVIISISPTRRRVQRSVAPANRQEAGAGRGEDDEGVLFSSLLASSFYTKKKDQIQNRQVLFSLTSCRLRDP